MIGVHRQLKDPVEKFWKSYDDPVNDEKADFLRGNLSKAGWSWGCIVAIDREGRTIFVADAHRNDGKRFVVRADEKLTAFLEVEAAIRMVTHSPLCGGI